MDPGELILTVSSKRQKEEELSHLRSVERPRLVEAVRRAMKSNTRAVWCESPSNPMMGIVDVAAARERCDECGSGSRDDEIQAQR